MKIRGQPSSSDALGPARKALGSRSGQSRQGAAAVELAVLMSVLSFLFVVAVDYSRVFFYALSIQEAAYQGALYASASTSNSTDSAGITAAAQNETTNLSPQPTATSSLGTDSNGNTTVSVTVTYTFQTVVNYPGIPNTVNLSRTVTMRVLP